MNIVQVVEHGWLCGAFNVYYIDMELGAFALADYICYLGGKMEGDGVAEFVQRNESSLVDRERPFEEKMQNTWEIVCQIARGLAFIHRRGHAHRDLKPSNGTTSHAI